MGFAGQALLAEGEAQAKILAVYTNVTCPEQKSSVIGHQVFGCRSAGDD